MKYFTVVGAYGRTYATGKAMLKDWEAGLDFQIVGSPNMADDGRKCSKRDFGGDATVHGRYKLNQNIITLHGHG